MSSALSHTAQTTKFFENFSQKKLAILTDDLSTPTRSAFVVPAQQASHENLSFIANHTGGIFFVALPPQRVTSFLLSRMARPQTAQYQIPESIATLDMCTSVEAREGVSTGISIADRVTTIKILGEENPNPRKLVSPGHIFPIQTREGGVLVRSALPEGALDIVRHVGFTEAACLVDILNSRGEFMEREETILFARREEIPSILLSDLVHHLLATTRVVTRVTEAALPTELAGTLRAIMYHSTIHNGEHIALVKGDISAKIPTLTRVQTELTITDVFGGSTTPSSRSQLNQALRIIGERGSGVLVYLRKPVEGQMQNQLSQIASPQIKSPSQMMREYGLGAQILRDLGVKRIELLSNNAKKLVGLHTFGIEIVKQTPLT